MQADHGSTVGNTNLRNLGLSNSCLADFLLNYTDCVPSSISVVISVQVI